jgi:hypothetical protein
MNVCAPAKSTVAAVRHGIRVRVRNLTGQYTQSHVDGASQHGGGRAAPVPYPLSWCRPTRRAPCRTAPRTTTGSG